MLTPLILPAMSMSLSLCRSIRRCCPRSSRVPGFVKPRRVLRCAEVSGRVWLDPRNGGQEAAKRTWQGTDPDREIRSSPVDGLRLAGAGTGRNAVPRRLLVGRGVLFVVAWAVLLSQPPAR